MDWRKQDWRMLDDVHKRWLFVNEFEQDTGIDRNVWFDYMEDWYNPI